MFGEPAVKIALWIIGVVLNHEIHIFDAKIELIVVDVDRPSLGVVEGGISVLKRFVIESNGLLIIHFKIERLVAVFSQNSSIQRFQVRVFGVIRSGRLNLFLYFFDAPTPARKKRCDVHPA
jgi:hypothetical protein